MITFYNLNAQEQEEFFWQFNDALYRTVKAGYLSSVPYKYVGSDTVRIQLVKGLNVHDYDKIQGHTNKTMSLSYKDHKIKNRIDINVRNDNSKSETISEEMVYGFNSEITSAIYNYIDNAVIKKIHEQSKHKVTGEKINDFSELFDALDGENQKNNFELNPYESLTVFYNNNLQTPKHLLAISIQPEFYRNYKEEGYFKLGAYEFVPVDPKIMGNIQFIAVKKKDLSFISHVLTQKVIAPAENQLANAEDLIVQIAFDVINVNDDPYIVTYETQSAAFMSLSPEEPKPKQRKKKATE